MKIKLEQLAHLLGRPPLAPVYLLVGEEILLIEEALQAIRETAKKQLFEKNRSFYIESGFDWEDFYATYHHRSLFSNQTWIELHFKNTLHAQAYQALDDYLAKPRPHHLLLITVPKLEKSAWARPSIKTIENNGVFIQAWPITKDKLPYWIRNRLKQKGFDTTHEAVSLIASQVEGNLLAAHQEIEKISLLLPSPSTLTAEKVIPIIHDNARYTVFNLVDTLLAGHLPQSLHILQTLREEGTESTLILWALAREIRLLLSLLEESEQHPQPTDSLLNKHQVWTKRQPLIKQALQKLSKPILYHALQRAARIDTLIKSNQSHTVWFSFSELLALLAQPGKIKHVH